MGKCRKKGLVYNSTILLIVNAKKRSQRIFATFRDLWDDVLRRDVIGRIA